MIKRLESVTIFSEDAKKLAGFYRDDVGLEVTTEAEIGDEGEELYGVEIGEGSGFYIVDHSKVKGKNMEPERVIINWETDDIKGDVKKLDSAGVKKVQDIYHMQDYGYIATFEDPEGNYFQLVQVKSPEG